MEFDVFTEIERHYVLPNIKDGFSSVDEFIKYANSIANRRKSRAGTSLELHLESIFRYEKLQFAHSIENWIVLLIFEHEHYRCQNCKHEWLK